MLTGLERDRELWADTGQHMLTVWQLQTCVTADIPLGNVVEIQVSFVAVPLKGEQFKMVMIMHYITLLDGTFGQV